MKFFGTLLIFLYCTVAAFGQNITLSGVLLDKSNNEAVIAAGVELLTAKDSAFVAGNISNDGGIFSLKNLSKGSYILKITYLGYKTLFQRVSLSENSNQLNIGKLYIETDDILLKETVIEGKRPDIVVKNDTIEYDATSYKTTENAPLEELLKKMPGVEVDKDGKISVNGKSIKKIMVEGKDFFSDDPQIASKNLLAEMVEKLQVIDRKSDMSRMTGFDDGEEETVINITARPGMKQGTIGNVGVGAGADLQKDKDARYQAGLFVNSMKNADRYTLIFGTNNNNNMGAADLSPDRFGGMRMRRGGGGGIAQSTNVMFSMNKTFSELLSLNGDVRYNGADRLSVSKIEQTTLSRNISQLDKTNTNTNYLSNNVSANLTLEWTPDTLNKLIFRPNFGYNSSGSTENEDADRFNYNNMDTIFNSRSNAKTTGAGYNFGGSLDYSHKFGKRGRVFSINMRGTYNTSYSFENSYWLSRQFENNLYASDTVLNQRYENDNRSNTYRTTLSWVEPLGKNNFIQLLYRFSYNDTKSPNSIYSLNDENISETTATLNDSLSRSTLRNSTEQRFGLNFKMVRSKYNLTFGFNVDPTRSTNETYQPYYSDLQLSYINDKRLPNVMGDSIISSIPLNVVNFSPVINFNYIFGQRTNLRIDYDGETNQPSASQLRDFIDVTRPTEWVQGNPSLKPGYQNRLRGRFQKYVPETQLMYNLDFTGVLSFNDINSVTVLREDGVRLTTYKNINGNWNTRLRGMFNIPLKNKHFTVGSFGTVYYNNQNSYVDDMKNTMKNFSVMDNANINYRSDLFDIGMNISLNYNNISYTVRPQNNQSTLSFGLGASTAWRLAHNFTIESDINYTKRSGYASQYNIPETMWNMAITKQLFNKRYGTGSLKLQVYDILQDRNSIMASSTTNGFRSSEYNVIPSYFMCSFIYKFSFFPKSSSATKADFDNQNRWLGGPGRPPGGER
ncbi:MAG: outer membrane beta-barrel protein [Dysgonamonadaceae bacterium]|jgi:hypothetical protein|nr:outer membrane beta-barrel protein [Dysgonamonadaceae bacterium]